MSITLEMITPHPLSFMGKMAGVCWNSDVNDSKKNVNRAIKCIEADHGRLLEFPEEPCVGHASHGDDLARREVQNVRLLGQYNGKKARMRLCRERGAVLYRALCMINDTPRKRWLQACEGAEKGRFANAVAADETHEAPGF